jgi:hypothetical protein
MTRTASTGKSYIPSGARELLKSCRSFDEVRQVCEAQKYTCKIWSWTKPDYVDVLFGDPATGKFREDPAAFLDDSLCVPMEDMTSLNARHRVKARAR